MDNRDNKLLQSLAPDYDNDLVDRIYKAQLDNILSEKEYSDSDKLKNKNIAISGSFSTGKSSVIRTYIRKSNYSDKTLFVTLGSYIEENDKEEEISEVENSVLQQIIYSEEAKIFSFTRINRLDKNKSDITSYSALFSLITSCLIFGSILAFNFENIYGISKRKYGMDFFAFLYILLFSLLYFLFYILLGKLQISKISIKTSKGNLETDDMTDKESFLNKNIDELISFFKNNDKEIIVFEDIDRLKSSRKLFTKLKEINDILNDSIKDKTIRFIFAVSDTVFDSEDVRTKFFDIIVPVIPYNSYKTSRDILEAKTKGLINLDSSDLRFIGNFTSNPRNIVDIVNEYIIFSSDLSDKKNNIMDDEQNNIMDDEKNNIIDKEKRKLFYLCTYKVLYPKRFELLYKNKGIISYFLSNDFIDFIKKYEINNAKLRLEKQLDTFNSSLDIYRENYYKEFLKYFDNHFDELGEDVSDIVFYDETENFIVDYNSLNKDHTKILLLNTDGVVAKIDNETSYGEDDIFVYLSKNEFFDKVYRKDLVNKINKIQEQLNNIDNYPFNFYKLTFKEKLEMLKIAYDDERLLEYDYKYPNDSDDKRLLEHDNKFPNDPDDKTNNASSSYLKLNLFEEDLIRKGIFDSSTLNLITLKHHNILNDSDDRVVKSIINGISLPIDTKIINSKEVLAELGKDYFSLDTTNIIDLYDYIVSNNLKDYYNNIFDGLTVSKIKFFKTIEEKGISLLEKSSKVNELWDFISEESVDDEIVYFFMIKTIESIDIRLIDKESFVFTVLENYSDVLEHLEKNFNKIKDNIMKYNVIFSGDVKFDIKFKKILKIVYENNMFDADINQMRIICDSLKLKVDFNKIFETSEKNAPNIYLKLIDNFDDIMIYLSNNNLKQSDSENSLIAITNELNLSVQRFSSFMDNETTVFKDITFLDVMYYPILLKNKKIVPNWVNVFSLFQKYDYKLTDEIILFINDNILELSNDTFNYDEFSSLRSAILNSDDISDENFKVLIKSLMNYGYYTKIKDIPTNRLHILIESEKIQISDIDNYNLLIQNQQLSYKEKANVIGISYDSLKDFELTNLTSDILCEIMYDNRISVQNRIVLLLKNKELFSNISLQIRSYHFLKNNDVTINSDDLLYLISNITSSAINYNDKISLFLKYKDILLDDYDIEDILQAIDSNFYSSIIGKERNLYIDKNDSNIEFLNLLIDSTPKLISYYYPRKNKIFISFKGM